MLFTSLFQNYQSTQQKKRVPWILEHPRTSRAFWVEPMQTLLKQPNVETVFLDQCMFGASWKQVTTLVCGNVDILNLRRLEKRCCGRRGNLCARSGLPHQNLRRQAADGRTYAAVSSAYPTKLCRAIAFCLTDEIRSQQAGTSYKKP